LSLPATEYWFSLSARRNRKSFLLATGMLFIVAAVVIGGLFFFGVSKKVGIILLILFGVPWIFVWYNLTAQRLRDFNMTGWLVLLWIPIYFLPERYVDLSSALSLAFWIILVFIPGTRGDNRYGSDPLEVD
jgi:uncharacterized membrane protein YhaH (DUF805 family)